MEGAVVSPNGDLTRVTVSGAHADAREVTGRAVEGEKSGGHNLEISAKQGHE